MLVVKSYPFWHKLVAFVENQWCSTLLYLKCWYCVVLSVFCQLYEIKTAQGKIYSINCIGVPTSKTKTKNCSTAYCISRVHIFTYYFLREILAGIVEQFWKLFRGLDTCMWIPFKCELRSLKTIIISVTLKLASKVNCYDLQWVA